MVICASAARPRGPVNRQNRSGSRPCAAARPDRSVTGSVLAGPVLAGPVLAGPVLAGPVLAGPVLAAPAAAGRDRRWMRRSHSHTAPTAGRYGSAHSGASSAALTAAAATPYPATRTGG